jgi:hypothetical protein
LADERVGTVEAEMKRYSMHTRAVTKEAIMRFNPRPYLSNKVVLAVLLTVAAGPALDFVERFSDGDANPPFRDLIFPPDFTPSEQDGVPSSTAFNHATGAQGHRLDEGAGSAEPTADTADPPVTTPQTPDSPATQQAPSDVDRYADERSTG